MFSHEMYVFFFSLRLLWKIYWSKMHTASYVELHEETCRTPRKRLFIFVQL